MIKSCEFRKFCKADDSSVIIIQHVWNLCSISSIKQEKKSGGGRRANNHFLLILICGTLNHFWTRPERNQLSAVVLWLWAARSLFSLYCTVCGSAIIRKRAWTATVIFTAKIHTAFPLSRLFEAWKRKKFYV